MKPMAEIESKPENVVELLICDGCTHCVLDTEWDKDVPPAYCVEQHVVEYWQTLHESQVKGRTRGFQEYEYDPAEIFDGMPIDFDEGDSGPGAYLPEQCRWRNPPARWELVTMNNISHHEVIVKTDLPWQSHEWLIKVNFEQATTWVEIKEAIQLLPCRATRLNWGASRWIYPVSRNSNPGVAIRKVCDFESDEDIPSEPLVLPPHFNAYEVNRDTEDDPVINAWQPAKVDRLAADWIALERDHFMVMSLSWLRRCVLEKKTECQKGE